MKIFLVTNYSSQFLANELRKNGHDLVINGFQELESLRFNEGLLQNALQCDCILVHFTSAQLVIDKLNGGTVKYTVERIRSVINLVETRFQNVPAIVVPMENITYFPSAFSNSDMSLHRAVLELNALFLNLSEDRSNVLLSTLAVPQHEINLKTYISAGCPYNWSFFTQLAQMLEAPIKNLFGSRVKGIILDLDNTCWEGVIGDLGLSGVRCRLDDGGEMYFLLQSFVAQAYEAGILVAISSKNEMKYVTEALRSEKIVLTEKMLTHIQANWEPKDANIAKIVSDWNISDSDILFLDDNPTERSLVKRRFKKMIIPDWDNLEEVFAYLAVQNIISPREVTNDDKQRTEFFKAETNRSMLSSESSSYEEFLKDLNLKMRVSELDKSSLARVEQLFQKTNQFNTYQRRFNKIELEKRIEEPGVYTTLLCEVEDRFSNYGIVVAVAASIYNNELRIDNWVMSCRVFKKNIEIEVLRILGEIALSRDLNIICVQFNLSERNGIVKEFLDKNMSLNQLTGEYNVHPQDLIILKTDIECKISRLG